MVPRLLTQIPRAALALTLLLLCLSAPARAAQPIKVGIIGLDAHAGPWAEIIQKAQPPSPIAQMRLVAAVAAPSADIEKSAATTEKTITRFQELGIELCPTIEALLPKVDAVMILSIDGRPHLAQARPAFAAKKPVFIDKPIASSLAEAAQIFREAQAAGAPCFTNSALRYGPSVQALTGPESKIGRILGADTYSNNRSILPGHPSLFYYGIHGCELLFALMGPGCQTVRRISTPTADIVIGQWPDGRTGTFRGILSGAVGFGAQVFGEKGLARIEKFEGYEPLLEQISHFFQTGQPPVTPAQTLELYAFLEAADESQRHGGQPVSLSNLLSEVARAAVPIAK